MAVNVTPDDLLTEAYRALGELTVHNRLIARHVAALEAAAAPVEEITQDELAQRIADGEPA